MLLLVATTGAGGRGIVGLINFPTRPLARASAHPLVYLPTYRRLYCLARLRHIAAPQAIR
eukprot:5374776-Pleurochrysis_carterae.AAC.1